MLTREQWAFNVYSNLLDAGTSHVPRGHGPMIGGLFGSNPHVRFDTGWNRSTVVTIGMQGRSKFIDWLIENNHPMAHIARQARICFLLRYGFPDYSDWPGFFGVRP